MRVLPANFAVFGLLLSLSCGTTNLAGQAPAAGSKTKSPVEHANFIDASDRLKPGFQARAYHSSHKYIMETIGSGVAAFDYDNDGRLDIFLVNGASVPNPAPKGTIPQKKGPEDWNRLYHQKSDGSFEDVTERAGLKGVGYGMGVAVGDFDNDGFEDLYVTAYGGNRLYRNNGDGTFTDVTEKSGTGGAAAQGDTWYTAAAWVDLDNDGKLDLVALRYVHWDFEDVWCGEHREGYRAYCHPDIFPAIRPMVYRNNGDGTFTEKGVAFGLDKPAKGLGIALADFNRDGKVDLAIANDSMFEFLYRNEGDKFSEIGLTAEIAVDSEGKTYAGMGIDFEDYDNDGLPDLVITNLAMQKYALYRNNGDGSFNYDTYSSGIAKMTLLRSGWGIRFFDYDNDGRKDLIVAQGHDLDNVELNFPQLHYREPMLLARNVGEGKFVDISSEAGAVFREPWVGRGLALGDFDNDGRLDAVVTINDGPAHLILNRTESGNHWLTLLLVGHTSNRDAIGANVRVICHGQSQYATVSTAGSYLSSSDKRVHFGLGDSTEADVEILWPSGIRQRLQHVSGNQDQALRIEEPAK
ncbi:CRTAC1 family protein [Terriglobus albidus]|uniref:CRTAC1 family protein n=1 Tax=Terriglobus albidus TaxID=1592106 RepID=A0A5B9EDG9_9BACT|nr:CRTAC1 family protein [Terriglobus albidus]QEE30243.1 CRTAC1 family protein [Terriglobus albidus]